MESSTALSPRPEESAVHTHARRRAQQLVLPLTNESSHSPPICRRTLSSPTYNDTRLSPATAHLYSDQRHSYGAPRERIRHSERDMNRLLTSTTMDSRDLLPSHLRTLAAGISNPDPPSRGRTPTPAPTIRSRRRSRSFSGERRRSLAGPGAGIFDALTGWFSSAAMTISTGATERGGKGLAIHNGEHVGWFGVSRAKDRVDQERGQESIQERSTTMNKTSSYASSSSTSSSTGPSLRSGSAEILPTFRAAAAQPYYVKRGEGTTRRDSPEYEPELYGDNPSLDDLADLSYYGSESARTPLLQSLTQRHPHPTSPMPNNYPPEYAPCRYSSTRSLDSAKFMSKSLTLEDIVPDLQRTSLRFTRKFPKLPVQMTRTGIGYSVLEGDLGGFGIEDIGRWTGFKWILLASVSTVCAFYLHRSSNFVARS